MGTVAYPDDRRADFIEAACGSGTLADAETILSDHPEVAGSDLYTAAIVGDDAAVRRHLAQDPTSASAKGGPRGWDALTYLAFSKYLHDSDRSDGFVRAAQALLDAGVSANTGYADANHQPTPQWESVLYGAAGVSHHPGLTRLLLERGADPNDEEVPYHAPETYDNRALTILVESGKLTADSLTTMLLRKADWHDLAGIKFLLDHGADPNRMTRWHHTALHQAVRRDNAVKHIETLLDYGGDPLLKNAMDGRSATSMAARRGRGDVLELFRRRGIPIEFVGVERLIAACAVADAEAVRSIAEAEPQLVRDLIAEGGRLLARFAGTGNTQGVGHLLDLGIDAGALYEEGDPYFGIAKNSTALHVAAWLAWHDTVKLLIKRGAPVAARDDMGRTALGLAVKACVDSYWTHRRSSESVEALLQAGASATEANVPSGYEEVDALLRPDGRDT